MAKKKQKITITDQTYKIDEYVYKRNIMIYIGEADGFEDMAKSKYGEKEYKISRKSGGVSKHFFNKEGFDDYWIFLPNWVLKKRSRNYWTAILSHETLHVAYKILMDAGVRDEEAMCYFHEYIFRSCLNMVSRKH